MRRPAATLGLAAIALLAVGAPSANAAKTCSESVPTIVGSPGPDSILGTKAADVIRAGKGADKIQGLDGNDVICAGPGNDVIEVGDGNDTVRAGAGDDRIDLGEGSNFVVGQGGMDRARGGDGIDSCVTESHEGCEADLSVSIAGPYPVTGGDSTVYVGTGTIENVRGSTALSPRVTARFPQEAEFVASASDPGCHEGPVDVIVCRTDPIGPNARAAVHAAFRFPDCPPAQGAVYEFSASASDAATLDPIPGNNVTELPEIVNPAANCP